MKLVEDVITQRHALVVVGRASQRVAQHVDLHHLLGLKLLHLLYRFIELEQLGFVVGRDGDDMQEHDKS